MPGVRTRNESAWLLPNDGSRTDHRLRDGMRRFADTDELNLVIVGCGAGGAVLLQRLGRAGWRGAGPAPGPAGGSRPWTRARSGTPIRTGSATRPAPTACTGPSRG